MKRQDKELCGEGMQICKIDIRGGELRGRKRR
jgi:hypothetical protein